MVLARLPQRSRLVPSASLVVVLCVALVSPAFARLSSPWPATQLDGARAIAAGHGVLVAVGSTGSPMQAAAWTSGDGLTWDEAAVPDAATSSAMTDVVATEDGFVAFGVESMVNDRLGERVLAWSSPDGLEWQEAVVMASSKPGREVGVHGLADGPAGTLALGSFGGDPIGAGRLWRSADGLTWERSKLPTAMRDIWLTDVVSVAQGYLLLGRTISGVPHNWRSADGVTSKELRGTPLLYDVAVSDTGALVGIGLEDIYHSRKSLRGWKKVLTRPDRWNVNTASSFGWARWDGAEFVVVGNDNGPCGSASTDTATDPCHREPLLASVDGTTWSEAAGPDGLPGADEGVWMRDVASLEDSTVVLGLDHGATTIWTIAGGASE